MHLGYGGEENSNRNFALRDKILISTTTVVQKLIVSLRPAKMTDLRLQKWVSAGLFKAMGDMTYLVNSYIQVVHLNPCGLGDDILSGSVPLRHICVVYCSHFYWNCVITTNSKREEVLLVWFKKNAPSNFNV